jgi:DNA-binding protein H-NS
MARDTYSALKLKIEKEIAKLQKQASTLHAKRRAPIIASIVRSMREYDISPEEITIALNKKPPKTAVVRKPAAPNAAKRAVPVKYRHPQSGETWTGRGKPPRWLVNAEADGKKRSDFLVAK